MRKKILALSIIGLAVITGVILYNHYPKQKQDVQSEKSSKKQLDYFNNYEKSIAQQKFQLKMRGLCENILVVNRGADYAQWLIKDYNDSCIVTATGCSFPNPSTCPDVVKYDVDLYFINHTKDAKKLALAGWLYDNAKQGKICLEASYATIESAHKADSKLGDLLDDVPAEASMTYEQILNLIRQNDGVGEDSYTNDKYDNYIHFYFDGSNQFQKKMSTVFDESGGYFSIQLIKSIVSRRNGNTETSDDIVNATVFEFRRAKMGSNEDRVVFSIGNDFYDFSQIPPNAGGKIYLYAFSPL